MVPTHVTMSDSALASLATATFDNGTVANAYLPNAHPGCVHDCILLVCDSCGRATHLDEDSIALSIRKAARSFGFSPIGRSSKFAGVARHAVIKTGSTYSPELFKRIASVYPVPLAIAVLNGPRTSPLAA